MRATAPFSVSNGYFSVLICAVAFLIFAVATTMAAQQDEASQTHKSGNNSDMSDSPRSGFLVLRGGQVLQGKISRSGDKYYVQFPHGEIIVRTVEVETCCQSLEEAYCFKRSLMHVGDVYGHIALAEWCLRNGLLNAAASELANAVAVDPQNPMVHHLERRLEAALRPPLTENMSIGATQTLPSRDELERLAKAMPFGAMETFTASIQPLLLNSCSTHDCHGPRSDSEFRLLRAQSGRTPSRHLTQRNLHAVMKWIDCDNPQASPLLVKPIKPHGLRSSVIFDDKNVSQYRQLVGWVDAVTRQKKSPSIKRPISQSIRNEFRPSGVLSTLGDVRQAAHTTSRFDGNSRAETATKGVEAAVFRDPYSPKAVQAERSAK